MGQGYYSFEAGACLGVPAMTFHAAARLRHFAGHPEFAVDTYRARITETGHLAWAAESF